MVFLVVEAVALCGVAVSQYELSESGGRGGGFGGRLAVEDGPFETISAGSFELLRVKGGIGKPIVMETTLANEGSVGVTVTGVSGTTARVSFDDHPRVTTYPVWRPFRPFSLGPGEAKRLQFWWEPTRCRERIPGSFTARTFDVHFKVFGVFGRTTTIASRNIIEVTSPCSPAPGSLGQ